MNTRRFQVAAALAIIAPTSACMGEQSSDDSARQLRRAVQAAEVEVAHHHQIMLAATSVTLAVEEVDRHELSMMDIMDYMSMAMGNMHMARCSSDGPMHDMMGAIDMELDVHRWNVIASATVDDMYDSCNTYSGTMHGVLADMHDTAMDCMPQ